MRFNSILVANRGEIACRIMQTAQFIGFKCVAVFVDAVKDAPFVLPETSLPQGLAGNSAYIIKPYFAEKLLNKLKQKGGWPNDALMCKQFFPYHLKVVYPYYTTLQGVPSTTTS